MKLQFKFFLLVVALTMLQCNKERDNYYAAPEWAGKPIYELLQDEGRFTLFLQCVDKSSYLASFKGNGYWTVFAPNDDAMKAYLTLKSYNSVDQISVDEANGLIAYNMLYSKYEYRHLADVLQGTWDTLKSVRKETPYYEPIYRERNHDVTIPYDSVWVLNPYWGAAFIPATNKKFLPFYLQKMFDMRGLTREDYNAFYPNATYDGNNVQGANIVKQDMVAANGVVHEVNAVNEPLPLLDKLLENDRYSLYKGLIETRNSVGTPYFIGYANQASITSYFQAMYPSRNIDMVRLKYYTGLDIYLNAEWPYEFEEREMDGSTLFAPTNEAIQKFVTEKLADYGFNSVSELPNDLKGYFINAHMLQTMVYPGEYKKAKNVSGCFVNGTGESGKDWNESCVEQHPASNGLFYGTNDYVRSPYFETVLTEIMLRSQYSYMNQALIQQAPSLRLDYLRCLLNGYENDDFIVLLPTDEQLKADGFDMRVEPTGYVFYHSGTGNTAAAVQNRLRRLVRSHVFRRFRLSNPPRPGELNTQFDLSASATSLLGNDYDGYSYAINDNGDMVRIKGNKLQMLGNKDDNQEVEVTLVKEFMNGKVYSLDKLLQYTPMAADAYTESEMIDYLKKAKTDNPNISDAVDYFELFATNTYQKFVLNKDNYWTILLPTNDSLRRCYVTAANFNKIDSLFPPQNIKEGLNSSGVILEKAQKELVRAIEFFQYHVIPGIVYVDDGYSNVLQSNGTTLNEAIAATSRKYEVIKSTFLSLNKDEADGNRLRVSTYKTGAARSAKVIRGVKHSNQFAPKSVIHEIDNILRFVPEK